MTNKQNNGEPRYQALSPLGNACREVTKAASHFSDLNGKTICELDGRGFRADETLIVIRSLLKKRFPGEKFIEAGTIFSPGSQDQAAGIREKSLNELRSALMQHGVDAVITGNGA